MVLPITSGRSFARTAGFAVPLSGAGTQTTGVVRCDQPRALNLAARGGKKLESVPEAIIDEVAMVNDSMVNVTPRQRHKQMRQWLRWKLACLGMPGFEKAVPLTQAAKP